MPDGPAPSKFEQRRAATRTALLRLGLDRLPVKGYSSTTVDDLVRDTGLTRGAFYFHFASKEEFFLALLEHRALQRHNWWLLADDPTLTTLHEIVSAVLNRLTPMSSGQWIAVVADFAQTIRHDTQYVAGFDRVYRRWIAETSTFMAGLDRRGLLRRDRTYEQLAASAYATTEGHQMQEALYRADISGLDDALVRMLAP